MRVNWESLTLSKSAVLQHVKWNKRETIMFKKKERYDY